ARGSLTRRPGSAEAQLLPLHPVGVEGLRPEPALVAAPEPGPVAVEHGEPGGVAVLPLDDHVLAEGALVLEAEALGGAPARLVVVVALPLEAAVAEVIEDIAGEQVEGLGGAAGAGDVR